MKARIKKTKEMVLCYHKGNEQLLCLLEKLHVPCQIISDSDLEKTISICLQEREGEQTKSQVEIPEPFLLFSGISQKRFDEILNLLHPDFPKLMKAVVTQHNQNWTVVQLYRELCRERKNFGVHQR